MPVAQPRFVDRGELKSNHTERRHAEVGVGHKAGAVGRQVLVKRAVSLEESIRFGQLVAGANAGSQLKYAPAEEFELQTGFGNQSQVVGRRVQE
jgi:hypothetical protein